MVENGLPSFIQLKNFIMDEILIEENWEASIITITSVSHGHMKKYLVKEVKMDVRMELLFP
jgi:hypothetical protein